MSCARPREIEKSPPKPPKLPTQATPVGRVGVACHSQSSMTGANAAAATAPHTQLDAEVPELEAGEVEEAAGKPTVTDFSSPSTSMSTAFSRSRAVNNALHDNAGFEVSDDATRLVLGQLAVRVDRERELGGAAHDSSFPKAPMLTRSSRFARCSSTATLLRVVPR